eukprot:scpid38721/ scgid10250/ 
MPSAITATKKVSHHPSRNTSPSKFLSATTWKCQYHFAVEHVSFFAIAFYRNWVTELVRSRSSPRSLTYPRDPVLVTCAVVFQGPEHLTEAENAVTPGADNHIITGSGHLKTLSYNYR